MKFICQKQTLGTALSFASGVVPSNTTIEQLKCFHISVYPDHINVVANNVDTGVSIEVPAQTEGEGSFICDAKVFAEIVRRIGSGEITFTLDDKYNLLITGGRDKSTIKAQTTDEYPPIPVIKPNYSFTLKQKDLKRHLALTSFACLSLDRERLKTIHDGVLFDITPGLITFVALNRHRLALTNLPQSEITESHKFVVHVNALKEIENALDSEDEDKTVLIDVTYNYAVFSVSGIVITVRLLEGEFHKYQNSIPQEFTTTTTLSKRDLQDCVELAGVLIDENMKYPVIFDFKQDEILITAKTTRGIHEGHCPTVGDIGEALVAGFNFKYILDIVKHTETDDITISGNGPLQPFIFKPVNVTDTTFMCLPVRIS